ncbi:metalloregulator ArsR/SmtB family transcription factor [Pseudonocardia kujensis]|uniref:ArsR/SmtB family transcription factor n=1 Tax=Pseudonocardia kujensis TaxID=1128675 RepID=UPI001E407280|nr:metalloregulator ArsR/SmtB family transcription factor [Pseudonocardia kujensis]MCE0764592.1 metalloregulator ArsR/SmtB family transcription factor [Pseudonocardia kujensis]
MSMDSQPGPPVSHSLLDSYVAFGKAIADPTRLDMLVLIGETGEFPCTALEQQLPISKSTISYHVKVLTQAGLVKVRREGRFFHYELQREVLDYFAPGLLARLLAARTQNES